MKKERLERLIALSISYALGGPGSGPRPGDSRGGKKSIADETPAETHERIYNRAIGEGASHIEAIKEANEHVPPPYQHHSPTPPPFKK